MVATIAWLLAIILLLASWTFVAAMLAQCVFSHSVHYTNAGTAMLTLTGYVVGNGWLDSQPMGAYDSGHVYGICFQVTSRFLLVGLVLSYVMTVLRVTSHYCEQQSEVCKLYLHLMSWSDCCLDFINITRASIGYMIVVRVHEISLEENESCFAWKRLFGPV